MATTRFRDANISASPRNDPRRSLVFGPAGASGRATVVFDSVYRVMYRRRAGSIESAPVGRRDGADAFLSGRLVQMPPE